VLHFVKQIPLLRLLIPYVFGLLLPLDWGRLLISIVLIGFWGIWLHHRLEQLLSASWNLRWMPGLCFVCLFYTLGSWNAQVVQTKAIAPASDAHFLCEVELLETPEEKQKSIAAPVQIVATDSFDRNWVGKKMQLYFAKEWIQQKLKIGDKLYLQLSPKLPNPPATKADFDAASWLRNKGICATSYVSPFSGSLSARASASRLSVVAQRVRQTLRERFERGGMHGQELALVSALTLGTKFDLDASTKNSFSSTGISHILSVSGLHVAVIYGVMLFLLSIFDPYDRFKTPRLIFVIVFLFFYAFITGLSPSVLRSVFMFSMLAFGQCMRRKSLTINTVVFTAFVLLLVDPGYIRDVGFQLSYLAVFFLVVVYPKVLELWTPKSTSLKRLWELICLSMTAQLGTAPLTMHLFHVFPNYFLLNNLIAVPFSSLLIYLSGFFLSVGWIPVVSDFVGALLNTCLHVFLLCTKLASEWPFALTRNIHLDGFGVGFLYLVILTMYVFFLLKKRRWVFPLLASVFLCELYFLMTNFG
jgi:competence protein ComEC